MNTGTPGITVTAAGHHIIDKEYRGVRIYTRLGWASQAETEERLTAEIERVETELVQRSNRQLRFADGAARYLKESANKRSVDVSAWHVRLLIPYIGTLELDRIHDAMLQPFIADRLAGGVSATTINRSLEVVRTILNRAARSYRDDDGRPWLAGVPPLIATLPETRRAPYPIAWEEQNRLFAKLPARLARMVLFTVNTGLRESNCVFRRNVTAVSDG
jgi:integrase